STKPPLRQRGGNMGSVGDELLVARLRADESRRWRLGRLRSGLSRETAGRVGSQRLEKGTRETHQADDGGAGELLRWDRAAGGRRGVGQVPRRHGLEEPLGRRRACGRAGRRRRRPAGSSRHARSAARTRDARTSKEQKDTASEPGSAATTSTRRSDRSAARLLRGRVAFASRRSRDFGRGSVQRGKRKRDGSSQRRVRGQEARQDRDDHDAQREFQRARAARRRTVGGGALLGQRPAGHARAFVDVVGVARGRVDVGVPAVPITVQHHRGGGVDSSA
ncbi:unnamed protein product, partial [Pelagomonas calceolata]